MKLNEILTPSFRALRDLTQSVQIPQIINILRNLGFKELFLGRSQRLLMDDKFHFV